MKSRWWLILIGLMVVVAGGCNKPAEEQAAAPGPADDTGLVVDGGSDTSGTTLASDAGGEMVSISYTCQACGMDKDEAGERCNLPMAAKASNDSDVEYYCPMHPDMVESDPGMCEPCGHALHGRVIASADTGSDDGGHDHDGDGIADH